MINRIPANHIEQSIVLKIVAFLLRLAAGDGRIGRLGECETEEATVRFHRVVPQSLKS